MSLSDVFGKIKKAFSEGVDASTRTDAVKNWLDQLTDAEKREKDWRKNANQVIKLYEQEDVTNPDSLSDFNILFANTETLAPAVYNNTPRPVVKRKVDRENPIAIAAAQIVKAALVYLTDTGERDKATFDDLQKDAVLESLVPGRGMARFYYEATSQGEGDASFVEDETVCGEQVPWNRVLFGYAKNWQGVPWIAYEHFMTREECVENFGDVGKNIKLTHMAALSDDKENADKEPADAEGVKFAHIWEVWDRRTRKITYLSEGLPTLIKEEDDPYGLDGFFDCPKPIGLLQRVSSLQPRTLYSMYEKQARELEKATRRIDELLGMLKVRGFYDGTLEGLDELLKKPNGTLTKAANVAALQQGQSLENSVWLFPVEKVILVVKELYLARQQIISVIYQITGIADIMRGASQASETLGAQEIKQAWGTMRLKRMQKEVQRFTRDCYRIQAELVIKKFSIDTLKKMTGVKLPMNADKQQAQAQVQQLQQIAQQATQAAQQMGAQAQQAGQPAPPPPQPPQQWQDQMAQAQQVLQSPSWEDVVAYMRADSICHYIIDIETNSTIDIEATEDKQELAEMMNSMSQLMNGVFPMVEQGILPFQAAKSLMLAVINKFRLGDEVEETFRAMQEPQPKPDPATMKVQADIQRDNNKAQNEQQKNQQKFQLEQASAQQDAAIKQRLAEQEVQLQERALQIQSRELDMKSQYNEAKFQQDMMKLSLQAEKSSSGD